MQVTGNTTHMCLLAAAMNVTSTHQRTMRTSKTTRFAFSSSFYLRLLVLLVLLRVAFERSYMGVVHECVLDCSAVNALAKTQIVGHRCNSYTQCVLDCTAVNALAKTQIVGHRRNSYTSVC
jgi:hypothetical protein